MKTPIASISAAPAGRQSYARIGLAALADLSLPDVTTVVRDYLNSALGGQEKRYVDISAMNGLMYALQGMQAPETTAIRTAVKNDLETMARVLREQIKDTGEPDRVKVDGVWYDGPLATAFIQMIEANAALAETIAGKL